MTLSNGPFAADPHAFAIPRRNRRHAVVPSRSGRVPRVTTDPQYAAPEGRGDPRRATLRSVTTARRADRDRRACGGAGARDPARDEAARRDGASRGARGHVSSRHHSDARLFARTAALAPLREASSARRARFSRRCRPIASSRACTTTRSMAVWRRRRSERRWCSSDRWVASRYGSISRRTIR